MITFAEPIDADVLRIRHEFLSCPDRSASADEIAERFELGRHHALVALESLVVEGFLARTPEDRYVRAPGAGPCVPR